MGKPELAKKNKRQIFLGAEEGGIFDVVFGPAMTAEKVIAAHRLYSAVGNYVESFLRLKRKKERLTDWQDEYASVLGTQLVQKHAAIVDQVIPQSTVFLSAIAFEEWVNIHKKPLAELIGLLEGGDYSLLNEKVEFLIDHQESFSAGGTKSWPSTLKRQVVFENLANFLRGRKSA